MQYESSQPEKPIGQSEKPYWERSSRWMQVMPIPQDDIAYDDDCPSLDSGFYINPVRRFNGRIIERSEPPIGPIAKDILAYIHSRVPEVQTNPDVLGGMPVFEDTSVPIKRMFDYLLIGKSIDDFLRDFPSIAKDVALRVLENEATLFYEDISIAMDAAVSSPRDGAGA